MDVAAAVGRAREHYHRHAWADAVDAFQAVDRVAPLAIEDLERLAESAHILGRGADAVELLQRVYEARVRDGVTGRAVRTAFYLWHALVAKGEFARASGWIARAWRLIESEPDCAELAYLLIPDAEREVGEGKLDGAFATASRIVELAGRIGDRDLVAIAVHIQGRARIKQGRVVDGLALLDEALVEVTTGATSAAVTSWIATRRRVTGVRLLRGAGAERTTIDADLVVDATGRGSRAPAWLKALGYEPPRQEQLTVNLMYLTRRLRMRPGALTAKLVGVGAQPDRPSGFILLAQERDRWILTVFGYDGHHPARDTEGMLATVRAAAPEHVYAAVRDAEPLDDIVSNRFLANVRRRYERLRRFPAGFLVFGDAICSTSPAHATGMSAAAMQAAALRDVLAAGHSDLARAFFRAAAVPVNRAWQATVGADLALPQVKGPRPLPVRVIGRYAARALRAAARDQVVASQFLRVGALQDPSTRMFRPGIAIRVMRHGRRIQEAMDDTRGVSTLEDRHEEHDSAATTPPRR